MEITWREAKDYCRSLNPDYDVMEFVDGTVYVVLELSNGRIVRLGRTPSFSERLAWIEGAKHLDHSAKFHGRDDLRFKRTTPPLEIRAQWTVCQDDSTVRPQFRLCAVFRLPNDGPCGLSMCCEHDIRLAEHSDEKKRVEDHFYRQLFNDMRFVGYTFTLTIEEEVTA